MYIYVATSWRNEFQPEVVRILREDGHANELIMDLMNNEQCGCAKGKYPHPCPRCAITIDEAKKYLSALPPALEVTSEQLSASSDETKKE